MSITVYTPMQLPHHTHPPQTYASRNEPQKESIAGFVEAELFEIIADISP